MSMSNELTKNNLHIYFIYTILHLHQIMKGSVFTSVCLCVSVNKIPAERMHQYGRSFR